mgnify:FL=1
MKTVQQMLDLKPTTLCPALYKWSIKAAAMIRTQAAEIERLTKEDNVHVKRREYSTEYANVQANEALLYQKTISDLRKENEALKADSERYQWYVAQLESGNLDKLEEAFRNMERVEIVTKQMFDAAIDAMKGAT